MISSESGIAQTDGRARPWRHSAETLESLFAEQEVLCYLSLCGSLRVSEVINSEPTSQGSGLKGIPQ